MSPLLARRPVIAETPMTGGAVPPDASGDGAVLTTGTGVGGGVA